MKRLIQFSCALFALVIAVPAFASETTGSIETSGVSTGLQVTLACNPASVSNGTVNANTCVITCNSGYALSGQSCVSTAVSTGAPSAGGGGGGWSTTSIFSPVTSTATPTATTPTGSSTTTTTPPTTTTDTTGKPPLIPPSISIPANQLAFVDTKTNWAKNYIEALASRKIVNNTEKFRPDDSLTRAEFLKIIGNAAGWKTSSVTISSFSDVPATQWYATYVAYALSHGVIASGQNFRPNDPITRAEVAKMLVGALGLATGKVTGVFADVEKTSSLAAYIEAVKTAGIFNGQMMEGKLKFRPSDTITRSEIAKVVALAFKLVQ